LHHRVLDLGVRRLAEMKTHRGGAGLEGARGVHPVRSARAVDRGHAVEQRLHAVRQRLIGKVLVGEQCVAAIVRHLARVQHRSQRRPLEVADIGVPAAAEVARLPRLLADLDDLWLRGHAADEFVDLQLAEAAAESELLLRAQLLVVQEDHEVVEQCRADLADRRVRQRPGEVDARYLGAERAGYPVDPDRVRHGTALRLNRARQPRTPTPPLSRGSPRSGHRRRVARVRAVG
jgi:hypothetical protein